MIFEFYINEIFQLSLKKKTLKKLFLRFMTLENSIQFLRFFEICLVVRKMNVIYEYNCIIIFWTISMLLENFINYYIFLDANAFSSHSKLFRKLLLCLRLIFIQQLLKFNIFKTSLESKFLSQNRWYHFLYEYSSMNYNVFFESKNILRRQTLQLSSTRTESYFLIYTFPVAILNIINLLTKLCEKIFKISPIRRFNIYTYS